MPLRPGANGTLSHVYSYSGADARAYVYYEGMEDQIIALRSVHTVSVSVHEAKGQVRALGFKGIKGKSRGLRTIAGSLIMTVIEDNPLRPLLSLLTGYEQRVNQFYPGWSVDRLERGVGTAIGGQLHYSNRLASLIPPFNMMIQYVSEGALYSAGPIDKEVFDPPWGNLDGTPLVQSDPFRLDGQVRGASDLIRGIEFLDEGKVTSVNDMVTEVTYSFIADDYKPLAVQGYGAGILHTSRSQDYIKAQYVRNKLFRETHTERFKKQETALQTVQRERFNRVED